MVAETQNEDRESGKMSFVLRASETKRMVRSLTGIETLPVGGGGVQVGRMGFFISVAMLTDLLEFANPIT